MDTRLPAELDFPLERRLGKPTASKLEKHLHLETVGELLQHFPRKYLKRGELTPIADMPVREEVTLIARVQAISSRRMRQRKGMLVEVTIADDSGTGFGSMSLTFFNGYTAEKQLSVGTRAMFSGKSDLYRGRLTLTNPDFVLLADDDQDPSLALQPVPVYAATAKVPSWTIARSIGLILDSMDWESLQDPVPEDVAHRHHLMPLRRAYELIHRPTEVEEAYRAQNRFRFQEALVLQTALARRRALSAQQEATARPPRPAGLLDRFDADLPFTLTKGQDDVGQTLSTELGQPHPMNRLLQGEVGSGKTVVALRAMLQVIDAGGQAAMLAPTEVLAVQHYHSIRKTLGPLAEGGMLGGDADGTRVVLLTGSMTTAQRKVALLEAASGDAGIIIGTHALLSENVSFYDLGLIVVDEQHRFGVEQRDLLRAKATRPPHLLVMTATPIPRTIAMTVFGDLETSTLSELPAGRAPISTHVVGLVENPAWVNRIWQRAREEIDAGRQIYVVCPKIGEANDDDMPLPADGADAVEDKQRNIASVTAIAELVESVPSLQGTRIGVLHGKLDSTEKTETMAAFTAGEIDLLISTTVIEVGVDVHNATVMVILDADRFGMSQLHQLRGRVGRGGLPGTCLLVTQLEPDHPSRERLDAVASTTDGFELSQKDLELRREGDILGASQSGGKSTLKLLRVIKDEKTISKARIEAREIIDADLHLEQQPSLRAAIMAYLDPEKEAFLERG